MVAAAGAGALFWIRSRQPPAPSPQAAPQAQTTSLPPAAPIAGPGLAPPAAKTDARSLLESVSSDPLFRSWVAQGDLVRRWAVVTDNLAEGVTPRRVLGFLAPGKPFSAVPRAGELVISPESYERYDAFAAAVASVDARALARAYRLLHAPLETAYRELGYPGASLDLVTARALRRIEGVPVPRKAPVVQDQGGVYVFADSRLEELRAVEKHLLRMGPRNAGLLQQKAREIREALRLPGSEVAQEKR